jgi:recombination protein RecA
VIDLATAQNILSKSGTWFTYGETRLGQGRDRARQYLEENPKITAEIRAKVLEAYLANGKVASVGKSSAGDSEE